MTLNKHQWQPFRLRMCVPLFFKRPLSGVIGYLVRFVPLWWHWPNEYVSSLSECSVVRNSQVIMVFRRHLIWIVSLLVDDRPLQAQFRMVHLPFLLPITERFPWHQCCLTCLSVWFLFISNDLWNAVVCFQPPSLLIGKVWVPVIHFWACPIHWRVDIRLGSCRLTSVQLLIGSTIWIILYKLWSVGIGGSVLSTLTNFLNRLQQVMVSGYRSKLVNAVLGVPHWSVSGLLLFLLHTSMLFSTLENKRIGYADDSTLIAAVPSTGVKVSVAESLNRDLAL